MGDHEASPSTIWVPFPQFKFFSTPKFSASHLKEQKSKMIMAIVIFGTFSLQDFQDGLSLASWCQFRPRLPSVRPSPLPEAGAQSHSPLGSS